ncbi:MAG: electron transfer flavoprotein subunit beta/FixA family protein [Desulfuromonadales bacterium]|nr:electron transfer flavoprotein subunit beta/FixA family protein [Desulfuromonadales bacterium]NIS41015.1 electron transfer flavoprotein subunit beta/FixA family protein [Desulfuromonadales bacterium]
MKILVCLKQVPDMESKFKINEEGIWYDESNLAWRINEYDEYAVEQAVQVKEQLGEAELVALSVGPDRVKEAIKKALAMGCDRGVHINDADAWRRDPFEIASLIAGYAKGEEFDLVFTGMQSQDRGSAQVGVLLAEMLGRPALTTVVDFALEDGAVTVKRELEGGMKACLRSSLPAVVTCQLGLNTPRYPTLPNIMKAKRKEMKTVELAELAAAEARQVTDRLAFPEKKGGGLVLEGEAGDLAGQLAEILREKVKVL